MQWLICFARKHDLIPVLPSLRCSWTDAARDGWLLQERCSWYMRYNFPGDSGSYRDHTFLNKFQSLSKQNSSFALTHSQLTSFDAGPTFGAVRNFSLGSLIVISPQFWLERKWNWFIRDWLSIAHRWVPVANDGASLVSLGCSALNENPRSSGCC